MGLFDGIEKAELNNGGTYLRPGVYPKLEIEEFKAGRTRKKEDFVVVKVKIVESSGPEANPVGSTADVMTMMRWDGALGHIKGFLAAAMAIDVREVDAAGTELAIGEEQPLRGMLVACEASSVETKSGGTFTKVRWYPYAEKVEAPAAPVKSGLAAKLGK